MSRCSIPARIIIIATKLQFKKETVMTLRRAEKKDYKYVKKLYREAFPLIERMPFSMMRRNQEKGKTDILVACADSKPCAVVITMWNGDAMLLNYLAVDPAARGQGIGSQIITALAQRYSDKRIVLEIEKPDEKKPETVRRKNFYLRNGLEETDIEITLAGVPMELLTLGGKVSEAEYLDIYRETIGSALTSLLIKIKYSKW